MYWSKHLDLHLRQNNDCVIKPIVVLNIEGKRYLCKDIFSKSRNEKISSVNIKNFAYNMECYKHFQNY